MNYMSVCSGVEAASLAWKGLGWKPVAFSEIEPFPCAVLAERFPGVPNLGDMTKIEVTDDGISGAGFTVCRRDVDLLVGGTPCQSFSVAGRREGLKGASGLAYHFVRLLREIQPKWFVWENVPGALSSRTDGQLDFNFLVGAFAECGYGLAWRILDAQYVRSKSFPLAIPQRRRRLFVVGCLGDGERAGKVLFDGESLSGDTPPRRIKMQWTSGCAEGGADVANEKKVTCYENHAQSSRVVEGEISPTLNCMGGGSGMLPIVLEERKQGIQAIRRMPKTSDAQRMPANGFNFELFTDECKEVPPCLGASRAVDTMVYDGEDAPETLRMRGGCAGGGKGPLISRNVSLTLATSNDQVLFEKRGARWWDGTGGGNTPLVQEVGQTVFSKTGRPTEAGGCPNFKETGVANTLNLWDLGESRANEMVVVRDECFPIDMRNATRDADKKDDVNRQGLGVGDDGAPSPTVTANPCGVGWRGTVRRLLPVETERLMGFPDNWTRIPWRGKPAEQCPDGPRYKACGNSMCVNCMEWIGERLEEMRRKLQEEEK